MPVTRTCGDCCLCCHTLGVRELEKPALKWCEHCDVGSSHACKIYESRPQSCRDFQCLWLTAPQTPEAMWPKRSGVVVWVTHDAKRVIALTRPHQPTAWRNPAVLTTLRNLAKGGMDVIAFSGNRAWLIGPIRDEELPSGAVTIDEVGLNRLTISADIKRRVAA